MKLTPLKCPHCGAKLKIAGNTVLAACQYCGHAAEFTGESAIKLDQIIIKSQGPPDILLPFWRISYQAKISSLAAHAPQSPFQQDGAEAFSRGKDVKPEDLDIPSRMLVAAFKVNNFINYTADLSQALSLKLDHDLPEKMVEKSMDYGLCYYGHLDAQGMVEVLLRVLANKKSRDILDLDFDIKWGERNILWWPFKQDGDCWRDMLYEQRLLQSALEK
jgi:hypothetical protein